MKNAKLRTVFASAGTLEDLKKSITSFYGGEEKEIFESGKNFWILRNSDGRLLDPVIIYERKRYKFGSL